MSFRMVLLEFLSCLLLTLTQSDEALSLQNFTLYSPMPFNGSISASYMTESKQDIWLFTLSGKVFTYNIDSQSYTRQSDTPYPIKVSYPHSSVAIGNTIYFNPYDSDGDIGTYNIHSQTWTNPMHASLPMPVTFSCLATDGRYLYVIGGYNSSYVYLGTFQVYDTQTLGWFNDSDLSSLNVPRASGACQVSNGYVYVIGGQGNLYRKFKSIERIYVGAGDEVGDNLYESQWELLETELNQPKNYLGSVICRRVDPDLFSVLVPES